MVQNIRETNITMTTITLSWEPLPCSSRNGNITRYQINLLTPLYGELDIELETTGMGSESYTFRNLIPGTEYTITISGNSSEGLSGPTANATYTTRRVQGEWVWSLVNTRVGVAHKADSAMLTVS